MNVQKRTRREKIKILLSPIHYGKEQYWILLFTEIYDGFQSIFTVQIGVWIIWAIEKNDIWKVKYYIWILIWVFVLTYILRRISEMSWEASSRKIEYGLQKKYLWKYIHLDNTGVEAFGTGKMSNIIFEGIWNRTNMLGRTIIAIVVEVIAIFYAFTLVAAKTPNLRYFLVFLGLFLVNAIFIFVGLNILTRTRKKAKEIYMEMSRKQIKILMSKFEILQNDKFESEIKPIEDMSQQLITLWQRGNTKKLSWQMWSSVVLDGMQIGIYLIIGIWVITWQYTFAYLMLLIQLLGIISKYVRNIRSYFKEYYKSITHIDKLIETFESIKTHREKKDAKIFIPKSESIQLKNITFGYSPRTKVFRNFSLLIDGGKKTAFVGPSGGGKTTLIKLIAWYIRPDKWDVVVDGQKLWDISFKSYYKRIWYLTQEPSVFDGTIYENLVHAIDEKETQKKWFMGRLKQVISLAKCDFVFTFKEWINTEIWERWIRLSWGQKQRLAIAKIMLKDPEIVILDEPTSALDSISEQAIAEALQNLFSWRTVLVVAHRLQTVKEADDIIVIKEGNILERGTHQQLIKLNGEYKQMLDLQTSF